MLKANKGKGKYENSAEENSCSFKERDDRGSQLCFVKKETDAERYFLISVKRIAELAGKLGYPVIMSRNERDNKSSRMQTTLSRSDHSLGMIRTN